MNVLSALDSKPARPSKTGPKKAAQKSASKTPAPKKDLNDKPHVSADEIRAKLAAKDQPVEKAALKAENRVSLSMSDNYEEVQKRSSEAKRMLAQKKQAADDLKAQGAPGESKVSEGGELPPTERPSDVGKNDPKDPATVGKLKDLLSKGAFKFSDKEREALSRILT